MSSKSKVYAEYIRELDRIQAERQALEEERELWREYVAFLNRANEGPIRLAAAHGWRCPQEHIQEGEDYRRRLGLEVQGE